MSKKIQSSEILVKEIVAGIEEVKGEEVAVLDLRQVPNAVTDFFVICQAQSSTQISAIADSIEKEVRKKLQDKPWHVEKTEESLWVLMDYVNVVVHIFEPQLRAYYQLEKNWSSAIVTNV